MRISEGPVYVQAFQPDPVMAPESPPSMSVGAGCVHVTGAERTVCGHLPIVPARARPTAEAV